MSRLRKNSLVSNVASATAKASSLKAAQVASLERFNKMVAAKYPDLGPECDLPEKFTCAVCWQIMVRPTHCIPCRHSFCEPCLRSVSSAAKGRFRSLCPYCRQSIHYTSANQDLQKEIKDANASEYQKRLEWLEQQHHSRQLPLPGFAPLRWISRVCRWGGPRTSKFVDFAERQLFNQCAFFALQLDEDHFSRTPTILTTIFDLLLVLFFYFAFPFFFFPKKPLLDDLVAPAQPKKSFDEFGECVMTSVGSSLLYLLPFTELDALFAAVHWVTALTLILRGWFRFSFKAYLHMGGADDNCYLPIAVVFLCVQVFACLLLAQFMMFVKIAVPNADSKAGFACILLGLALLLHLPSMITKLSVNIIIWSAALVSLFFPFVFCTSKALL